MLQLLPVLPLPTWQVLYKRKAHPKEPARPQSQAPRIFENCQREKFSSPKSNGECCQFILMS
jgi:hypothetical protein